MRLQSVHAGDVVECDIRGRRFFALVRDHEERQLVIAPINRNITYTRVKAREVINHYRKSRGGRP